MKDWQEQFEKEFGENGTICCPIKEGGDIQCAVVAVEKFIQSLLDQQKQELLEKIKLEEKTEGEGWDILESCCPGDDAANGYNHAVSDLEELKKNL